MTTSVILLGHIVNEELATLTVNTLDSLVKTTGGIGELVVVDNGSPIGGDILQYSATTYIRNNENRGYPVAVNQAFDCSRGDLIAVANNDIRVSSNWREVSDEIFKDPTVGSVHFRMIDYDELGTLGAHTWITGRERWCTSSFFVIRRAAFPYYDEVYKEGGYDDWDLWHRVRHLNGWKTAYTTKAYYQHKHSSTYIAIDTGDRAERDKNNREYFKLKFGKYAEDIWNEKYPDQMKENYYDFFKTVL